jgi:hypothetical protein
MAFGGRAQPLSPVILENQAEPARAGRAAQQRQLIESALRKALSYGRLKSPASSGHCF